MKRIQITITLAALLWGGLSGCYDDKGNYKYKDINEMTVTIVAKNQDGKELEINEDGYSRYKQPSSADTLQVIYTPEVVQTMQGDESNLEFLWKVSHNSRVKEYTSKELVLNFPPQQQTAYTITFSVTDVSNNISFYKSLSIKTVKPYMNSWFILNGPEGDRRIATIEDPDSSAYVFTADAYMDLGNERRFQGATGLIYSPSFYYTIESEILQIIQPDSILIMSPFDMKVQKSNSQLLPSVMTDNNRKIRYGIDGNTQNGMTLLVDDANRFYYASAQTGDKYQEMESFEVPNYRVGKIGKPNESQFICFWDEETRQFMYANASWQDAESFGGIDMTAKEVVWIGLDNQNDKNAIAMALVKEISSGNFWIYHFSADGFKVRQEEIGSLGINSSSQIITAPVVFPDQFFYTVDTKLYVFNVASKETFELYDAEATITQLKFRTEQTHTLGSEERVYRCLGMAVDKATEGEFHEVVLSVAGDVESVKVFTGFGPIQDFCFTFLNRIAQ